VLASILQCSVPAPATVPPPPSTAAGETTKVLEKS
jgi:hypothetical protein